jgi:hypothetical protein
MPYSFYLVLLTWQFLHKPQGRVTTLPIQGAREQNNAQKIYKPHMFLLHSSIAKLWNCADAANRSETFQDSASRYPHKRPDASILLPDVSVLGDGTLLLPGVIAIFLSKLYKTLRQLSLCNCCIAALSI